MAEVENGQGPAPAGAEEPAGPRQPEVKEEAKQEAAAAGGQPEPDGQPNGAAPKEQPAARPRPQPGRRGGTGGTLESPVLLPLLTAHVEPSPSTSMLAPPQPNLPLFAGAGPRQAQGQAAQPAAQPPALPPGAAAGSEADGYFYPWAYPKNCIAPSRNRQERPRREGAANDDGYNWRKYGEKQVKGSPYPRSYYKCSYPGCPVKKIIERDPRTGRVSEAVTKGAHNHAKPGTTRGSGGAVRAREAERESPHSHYARHPGEEEAGAEPGGSSAYEDAASDEALPEEARDGAAAALQLLGTGFSPDVPRQLSAPYQDTPSTLLPIPPSLRTGSAEPEDPRHLHAVAHAAAAHEQQGGQRGRKQQRQQQGGPAEDSEEEYDSEAFDSGDDDDAWEPSQADYRAESAATAAAAALAAHAAAAAAAANARRRSTERGAAGGVPLGKRKRKPRRDEDYVDPAGSEEDEELKVMRNMGNGHRRHHSPMEEDAAAPAPAPAPVPRRRKTPATTPSPQAPSELGGSKRGGGEGGGAEYVPEERNTVEFETDADNMDDGYRWRKYGQKTVKGNPYPRSYYKCTHPGCNVRKQVERSGKNSRMLSTTYEGTHNHEAPSAAGARVLPRRGGSSAGSKPMARPPLPDGAALAAVLARSGLQAGTVPVILTQGGMGPGTMQLALPSGLQLAQMLAPGMGLVASPILQGAAQQQAQQAQQGAGAGAPPGYMLLLQQGAAGLAQASPQPAAPVMLQVQQPSPAAQRGGLPAAAPPAAVQAAAPAPSPTAAPLQQAVPAQSAPAQPAAPPQCAPNEAAAVAAALAAAVKIEQQISDVAAASINNNLAGVGLAAS